MNKEKLKDVIFFVIGPSLFTWGLIERTDSSWDSEEYALFFGPVLIFVGLLFKYWNFRKSK